MVIGHEVEHVGRTKGLPVRMHVRYNETSVVIDFEHATKFHALKREVRDMFWLPDNDEDDAGGFTMKWMDMDRDAITLGSQMELNEMLRLYDAYHLDKIVLFVFTGVASPGKLCQGEDKRIYKRGARRWNKFYRVNGHNFEVRNLIKLKNVSCVILLVCDYNVVGNAWQVLYI